MVRGTHQENIVFRLQVADFGQALLDHLNIVLRYVAIVSGQESIHLVEEDQRRAVLLGAGKDFGDSLDRVPLRAPQHIRLGITKIVYTYPTVESARENVVEGRRQLRVDALKQLQRRAENHKT